MASGLIRPARECLDAIRNFPVPKNISSLRSFYGMINQINYSFLMTEHMEPFRHLLKSDTPYRWSPILQEKFERAKQMIVERFDIKRKTCLDTDWSNSGIGFFLKSTVHVKRKLHDAAELPVSICSC